MSQQHLCFAGVLESLAKHPLAVAVAKAILDCIPLIVLGGGGGRESFAAQMTPAQGRILALL